jgi:excinuclease UvrABC helicase subunit UvrB
MMMNTRAKVLNALKAKDAAKAVDEINEGIYKIENVYDKSDPMKNQSRTEVMFLKNWADEIVNRRTPTKRQRLVDELKEAVDREEFERAAKIRDRLNKLKE